MIAGALAAVKQQGEESWPLSHGMTTPSFLIGRTCLLALTCDVKYYYGVIMVSDILYHWLIHEQVI